MNSYSCSPLFLHLKIWIYCVNQRNYCVSFCGAQTSLFSSFFNTKNGPKKRGQIHVQFSIYRLQGSKRSKVKTLLILHIPYLYNMYMLVIKWRLSLLFFCRDSPHTCWNGWNCQAFHCSNWQFASEELNRGTICIWHWRFSGHKWCLPEINMQRSLSVCIWLLWEVQTTALCRGKRLCRD